MFLYVIAREELLRTSVRKFAISVILYWTSPTLEKMDYTMEKYAAHLLTLRLSSAIVHGDDSLRQACRALIFGVGVFFSGMFCSMAGSHQISKTQILQNF